MSIYKKLSKMGGEMSIDEKLYLLLNTEKYQDGLYKTCRHREYMAVVYQVI